MKLLLFLVTSVCLGLLSWWPPVQCEHLIKTTSERLFPAFTSVFNSSVLPKRSKFLEEARPNFGDTWRMVHIPTWFTESSGVSIMRASYRDMQLRPLCDHSVALKWPVGPLCHWEEGREMCTFMMTRCHLNPPPSCFQSRLFLS